PLLTTAPPNCSDAIAHLRPSPTRRSSDLTVRPDEGPRRPGRMSPHEHQCHEQCAAEESSCHLRSPPRLRSLAQTRERDKSRSGQDRKSTRLNSSHGSISYAVFCLQKNTNN